MSAKPKFTKVQIKTMGLDQCSEELERLNLDLSGGQVAKNVSV